MHQTGAIRPDLGLDGVQLVGDSERFLTFLNFAVTIPRSTWLVDPELLAVELQRHGVDIVFLVEGTGPPSERPGVLDGDMLSAATGAIVAANSALLPNYVPAGIPSSGVDFGLDALSMVIRKPDLIITQIRCDSQNRKIGYEVKNVGFATAPPGHYTLPLVPDPAGGMLSFHNLVPVALNPDDTYGDGFPRYHCCRF